MKILIACEFSGRVRDAFRKKGHDAWSCDLLPSEADSKYHIQEDVLNILGAGWDMMIAHPPCTYLCNSGVQHLHKDYKRWALMHEARDFFLQLLNCSIVRICIENPVPHRYCNLPKYDQIVNPYMFGENAQKKTCLWLKNLPKLTCTNVVDPGNGGTMGVSR